MQKAPPKQYQNTTKTWLTHTQNMTNTPKTMQKAPPKQDQDTTKTLTKTHPRTWHRHNMTQTPRKQIQDTTKIQLKHSTADSKHDQKTSTKMTETPRQDQNITETPPKQGRNQGKTETPPLPKQDWHTHNPNPSTSTAPNPQGQPLIFFVWVCSPTPSYLMLSKISKAKTSAPAIMVTAVRSTAWIQWMLQRAIWKL